VKLPVQQFGCSLGVMQGRLSPMIFGGYQAFPTELWAEEFELAKVRGLQHIEWVLDSPSISYNPILANPEIIKIRCMETGTRVVSVCADFLMDVPLDVDLPETWKPLDQLIRSMSVLGARHLVVPCVDASSVVDPGSRRRLSLAMRALSDRLDGQDIQIALETDLPPIPFLELLDALDPARFGVNYDIGNSASLGFDPAEELDSYGHRINLLHVKDRRFHGGSVPLGTGSADLKGVLSRLAERQFNGPVTLQCFRDKEGIGVFDQQLASYLSMIQEILHGS
jgi:L-ribulose-5-phosphate 3-epimerase